MNLNELPWWGIWMTPRPGVDEPEQWVSVSECVIGMAVTAPRFYARRDRDDVVRQASTCDAEDRLTSKDGQPRFEYRVAIIPGFAEPDAAPIPMRLVCEGCGELHVDEGEYATKVHHTHTCQHCGLTWRPAVGPTVGVRFLPGFQNEAGPPRPSLPGGPERRSLLRELIASGPWGPTGAQSVHGAPLRESDREAQLERECHFAIWNVTKNAWAGGVMVTLPRSLAGHHLASIQAAEPESTYEVRDVRTGKKVDSP